MEEGDAATAFFRYATRRRRREGELWWMREHGGESKKEKDMSTGKIGRGRGTMDVQWRVEGEGDVRASSQKS